MLVRRRTSREAGARALLLLTLMGACCAAAAAGWKPTDYKYDPPIKFFSQSYKKADFASRRCEFKTAYRFVSRSTVRTKGLKLKNPEQRMYFIRTLSVAYFATGRKKTAISATR